MSTPGPPWRGSQAPAGARTELARPPEPGAQTEQQRSSKVMTMPRTHPFPPVVLLLGLVALLFASGAINAATTINSNITSDTTWNAAGSPYRVVVSITVMPGAVLTIGAGNPGRVRLWRTHSTSTASSRYSGHRPSGW